MKTKTKRTTKKPTFLSVSNEFYADKFDELCKLLEAGETVNIGVSCIGHTRSRIVENTYYRELMKKYGDRVWRENPSNWTYHLGKRPAKKPTPCDALVKRLDNIWAFIQEDGEKKHFNFDMHEISPVGGEYNGILFAILSLGYQWERVLGRHEVWK